jgi:hypothetical protein
MMGMKLAKPKSTISRLTVGKIQLKPLADVLRFDLLLQKGPTDTVFQLVQESKDFETWVRNEFRKGGKGEKLIEAAQREDRTYSEGGKRASLSPSDLRNLVFRLFSVNQRAGGSHISAYPLIELDSGNYLGVETSYSPEKELVLRGNDISRTSGLDDMRRLSGYHIRIGRPYASILIQATSLLARRIDRVCANLSDEVMRRKGHQRTIGVEDLSVWCSEHLQRLMAMPNQGGRFIAKADFVLYPPPSLREKVLKQGSVTQALATELRDSLQKGEFCLSVFDISGGAAGVGLSERVSRHWGFPSSGNLESYVQHLMHAFDRLNSEAPTQVVIMPSSSDMRDFGSDEYVALWKAFREKGYRTYIATSEMYQERLSESPERLVTTSIDGEDIIIGGKEKTLIVRRYMYLNADKKEPRGIIPRHPPGTTVLPSDESRIVASDCRVNLPMLEHATRPICGSRGKDPLSPFRIIPFAFLRLEDTNAVYTAQGFLASCMDEWPEVGYLGGVVKPVDKVVFSGREAVRSAYPLPPIPTSSHVIDKMVRPLFDNLLQRGVGDVVVMPNILPLVVDQNHSVLPKFEIRMISLGA